MEKNLSGSRARHKIHNSGINILGVIPLCQLSYIFCPNAISQVQLMLIIEMKLHIWIELNCTRSISLAALFLEIIKKWIESKCILIGYEQHLGCSKGVKSKGLKLNRSNVVHIQIVCTCSRFKTYILYSLIQNIWPKVVYRWFVCRWFWPASHQMLLRTWHETTSTTMTLQ